MGDQRATRNEQSHVVTRRATRKRVSCDRVPVRIGRPEPFRGWTHRHRWLHSISGFCFSLCVARGNACCRVLSLSLSLSSSSSLVAALRFSVIGSRAASRETREKLARETVSLCSSAHSSFRSGPEDVALGNIYLEHYFCITVQKEKFLMRDAE